MQWPAVDSRWAFGFDENVRRSSRGSNDSLRFRHDPRAKTQGEGLGGYQLDRPPEMRFKEFGKGENPGAGFRRRCEPDQEIPIASRVRLAPQDRATQGEPSHAQGPNFPLARRQPVDGLLAAESRRLHAHGLSAMGISIQVSERPGACGQPRANKSSERSEQSSNRPTAAAFVGLWCYPSTLVLSFPRGLPTHHRQNPCEQQEPDKRGCESKVR
jgi:hypothetical protein